ncbi:hypothetical protein SAMN05428997_11845 [Bosea sp. CRIB-10]|uniref:hypothetical protein n=1 Tax=Bosea sp. CRIB-10 TaxID=378404 RepID=UPI0008E6A5A1|nr:hypothetical protein [Bosea sp. CRIB-10]SFD12148.1 hypothetical protein SAMN05428997_11845 [Bosea sp. CRIB-10]
MTWQPPIRELDPLAALVHEAVRTQVFPGEAFGFHLVSVPGESWREAALPDGRPVRIRLSASPAAQTQRENRACAGIHVSGELVAGEMGYRVSADLIVDLVTRAVLACDSRLEAVGRTRG